MKVTKPEEMIVDSSEIERIVKKFEHLLQSSQKGLKFYSLVLPETTINEICKEIIKIYEKAGWTGVKCSSSYIKDAENTILELNRF